MGQRELPSRYLDTLVGIGHHSNEQIDQHNDRDQHVNSENELKKHLRPRGLIIAIFHIWVGLLVGGGFQVVSGGLAENREKQQLKSTDRVLFDWNHKQSNYLDTLVSVRHHGN